MTDQSLPTELPPSEHFHGCPAPPDRVESYPLTRADGATVTVTRCIECGGHAVDLNPEEEDRA